MQLLPEPRHTGRRFQRALRRRAHLLSCKASNGDGETCLSDDPTQCPGPSLVANATFGDCVDQCDPSEFGVACGGPGPGPYPSPPDGCRQLPAGPGGGTVWCCPCGGAPSGGFADNTPATTPAQGAPCPMPGLQCAGYGTLSCPQTATCAPSGTWQIGCSPHPFGSDAGTCACPHTN